MKRRHGFTLVELLVSMALIIFMMAILSQAFQAALGVFRNLKSQGDLAEKLRSVSQILQNDLAADHFEAGRRLSDSSFWSNGPPQQGFFRVWHGTNPTNTPVFVNQPNVSYVEGVDASGFPTYRTVNHMLAFTVKKRGNGMGDFLSASAAGGGAALSAIPWFGPAESRYQITSGGAYNYQWAEVAWFLQPQVNPTTLQQDMTAIDPNMPDPRDLTKPYPPIPLYTLYRRQRLLVPDNSLVPPQPSATLAGFSEVSCWANTSNNNNNLYFNSPTDITVPSRRFGVLPPNSTAGFQAGLPYATTTVPTPYTIWPQPTTWVPPNLGLPAPPTYIPNPFPFYPIPYYPTLIQQSAPSPMWGADIQVNDVVSFDVALLVAGVAPNPGTIDPFVNLFNPAFTLTPAQGFAATPPIVSYNNLNPAFFSASTIATNPVAPMVFDTWTSLNDGFSNYSQWTTPGSLTSIPLLWTPQSAAVPPALQGVVPQTPNGPIIKAIRITLRIWDFKTNQTRQVTIVQAM